MIRFLLSVALVCTSVHAATVSPSNTDSRLAISAMASVDARSDDVGAFDDESAALAALKKAFSALKKASKADDSAGGEVDTETLLAAIRGLTTFDSEKVAKALIKAHTLLDEQVLMRSAARGELIGKRVNIEKGQEFVEKPTYPQATLDELKKINRTLGALRDQIDNLRTVQSELRLRIAATRDERGAAWLVTNVLGGKKHSVPLKLAVSRLAGTLDGALVDDLKRVFKRAKRPSEILSILEGVSLAGKRAQSLGPEVLKLLEHKERPVRERAAVTLGNLALADAIEPLIELLAREEGRTQEAVAKALTTLTRQNHGVLVASWRRWWADSKDSILGGSEELGGGEGMFDRKKKQVDNGYYFDIAMDGKSIMYIIDASGSMEAKIALSTKDNPDGAEQTRLEACKAELIGALGRLEKDAEFNIIWYNQSVHLFKEQMLSARESNIKEAQDWVKQLVPKGSTNIYDSLKVAFEVAGQGSKDKYYGVALDTIFLLTDGAPTRPDSKPDSTDKILEAVREWNALKRITIHAIGIGKGVNEGFLRTLADENKGEYRRY